MIRWFAGHPTAGNLLLILILAVGLFAAPPNLARETFPDYLPPEVSITMEYRGGPPQRMWKKPSVSDWVKRCNGWIT